MSKSRVISLTFFVAILLVALLTTPLMAELPDQSGHRDDSLRATHRIIGSWFGRAVPMDPFCTPGTPDCPVPPEVIMTPVFTSDGIMLGDDSLTFGGLHTTAVGDWRVLAPGKVEATLVWLQSSPEGAFIGGFRGRYIGEVVTRDLMEGYVNIYFFPFVGENGAVNLDPATGFPVPDPLTPLGDFIYDPADCNPFVNGCLAVLEFVIRRATVRLDD